MGHTEAGETHPLDLPEPEGEGDRALDVQVAMRVDGYRWVEWKHKTLAGAPLDEPGRFLGASGDPLAHLQRPADRGVPLAEEPYRNIKRYSTDRAAAFGAAEAVGLFGAGAGTLTRDASGPWRLSARRGIALDDECLARLLCRAVLVYLDVPADTGPA